MMTGNLKRDSVDKQNAGNHAQEEKGVYEDEINLMDFFLILWKRKWFIFFTSILPTVVFVLMLLGGAKNYKVSYVYDMALFGKDFELFQHTFYSAENLEKIVESLHADGFSDYAEKTTDAQIAENLKKNISFELLDSFTGVAEEPEEDKKLLVMSLAAPFRDRLLKITSACRNNLEQITPLYSEKIELRRKIIAFKEKAAAIGESRYLLDLQLEGKKNTLEKLEKSNHKNLEELPGGIVLHFSNAEGNGGFLPLAYQLRAAKTQIITLEEQIEISKRKYDYYTDLFGLNERLLNHLSELMRSHCTFEQYQLFLSDLLTEYKEDRQPLREYLEAYLQRIGNKMMLSTPLVEKPMVYCVSRKIAKKGAVVFSIALVLSMFAAFFWEGFKKNQAQIS